MFRAATTSNSRSQLFFALVWVVTTTMLVVALQTIGIPEAFGDDERFPVAVAADYPLEGADPADEEFPSALYAGVMWSITGAEVVPAEGLLDRSTIDVHVTLTNTLTATQLRVPDSSVSLATLHGPLPAAARFVDEGTRLALEPGESRDVVVSFQSGFSRDPDLGSLRLVIGEANREPASIPLRGEQQPTAGPVFAAVDTEPAVLDDPDDASRQIVVEPSAAALDVNAGPYRAALGEQLAVVQVVVQRTVSSPDAGFVQTDYWALNADGNLVAPILVTQSAQPASNSDELTLLFSFPANATDLSLVAANGFTETAEFSVVVPTS